MKFDGIFTINEYESFDGIFTIDEYESVVQPFCEQYSIEVSVADNGKEIRVHGEITLEQKEELQDELNMYKRISEGL